MVQHPRGGAALELLLLQDALKVLHALLQVPHVRGQMAVEEADRVAKHHHPRTHSPLIALGVEGKDIYLSKERHLLHVLY